MEDFQDISKIGFEAYQCYIHVNIIDDLIKAKNRIIII